MNYRVCVYAICKNEEKFARRWVASMGEADQIIVLDTGSSDNTVPVLRELGVTVYEQVITPWRFDVARNRSLSLVPEETDICVCTDLDELFEPGWRAKVEAVWKEGIQQVQYRYTWNFNPDGSEGYVFWIDKIHARRGFVWKHPVHEVLQYEKGQPLRAVAEGVQLNHHADDQKPRTQYLPLLELSVQEDPADDRNLHYLGREYFFYRRYEDSIRTLTRHLQLPSATWRDERCASLRIIGKCHEALGQTDDAHTAFLRAAAEAPYLREPWLDLARFYTRGQNWEGVIYACRNALAIRRRPPTYISEAASFGSDPYDLLSLGYYYTGQSPKALEAVEQAIALAPDDARLQENRRRMEMEPDSQTGGS